jgi:O-antigen ligase
VVLCLILHAQAADADGIDGTLTGNPMRFDRTWNPRPFMMTVANAMVAIGILVVLALKAGAGWYARPLYAASTACALAILAVFLRRCQAMPAASWLCWALVPSLILCLAQVLPFGWFHPWMLPDVAALGCAPPRSWSCDVENTWLAVPWLMALIATGVVWLCTFQDRPLVLGNFLVVATAADATLGLALKMAGTGWQGTATAGVCATFVYKNQAAAFWAAAIPLALYRVHRQPASWWYAPLAALVLGVVLSTSRGGLLVAAAINLPLAYHLLPRRRRWLYGAITAVMLVAIFTIIGVQDVAESFRKLHVEGATLNDRTRIWTAALPLIADAGPLGIGANATQTVFPRAGMTFAHPVIVNHLHNDVLEWLLEYGWAGAGAIGIGGLLAWWHLRAVPGERQFMDERRGALFGLAGIAVHSCAEFLWNREAIALEAVALGVIAAGARCCAVAGVQRLVHTAGLGDPSQAPSSRRGRRRWSSRVRRASLQLALVGLAGTLAAALPMAFRQARERTDADAIEVLIAAHHRFNARPSRERVTELMEAKPATAILAIAQARMALEAMPELCTVGLPQQLARQALDRAATLVPLASPAWALRARLAQSWAPPDTAEFKNAVARILAGRPADPESLDAILPTLCSSPGPPPAGVAVALRAAMKLDQTRDDDFFHYADRLLGDDEFDRLLTGDGGPELIESALPWLESRDGDHSAEVLVLALARMHTYREPPSQLNLYPSQEVMRPWFEHLHVKVHSYIPALADDRQHEADGIASGGLTMPVALRAAITQDPAPWSRWAEPLDFTDPAVRRSLEPQLAQILYHPWAAKLYVRMLIADAAVSGATLKVNNSWPADFVQELLAVGTGIGPAERNRLQGVMAGFRHPHFQGIDACASWTWILVDDHPVTIIQSRVWIGLMVDGAWKGWVKGEVSSAGMTPGLHRVAVILPPLPVWGPPGAGS